MQKSWACKSPAVPVLLTACTTGHPSCATDADATAAHAPEDPPLRRGRRGGDDRVCGAELAIWALVGKGRILPPRLPSVPCAAFHIEQDVDIRMRSNGHWPSNLRVRRHGTRHFSNPGCRIQAPYGVYNDAGMGGRGCSQCGSGRDYIFRDAVPNL